jgi:hypothetical protein
LQHNCKRFWYSQKRPAVRLTSALPSKTVRYKRKISISSGDALSDDVPSNPDSSRKEARNARNGVKIHEIMLIAAVLGSIGRLAARRTPCPALKRKIGTEDNQVEENG